MGLLKVPLLTPCQLSLGSLGTEGRKAKYGQARETKVREEDKFRVCKISFLLYV